MRTACDAFRARNSPRFDEVFFEIEKQSYPKLCPLVVLFLFFALLGLSLDVMLDPERQPSKNYSKGPCMTLLESFPTPFPLYEKRQSWGAWASRTTATSWQGIVFEHTSIACPNP